MTTSRARHHAGARSISRDKIWIEAGAADERRDPNLQDRSQRIILTWGGGGKETRGSMASPTLRSSRADAADGKKAGFALELSEPYLALDSDPLSSPLEQIS